jgi:hypothetical protein
MKSSFSSQAIFTFMLDVGGGQYKNRCLGLGQLDVWPFVFHVRGSRARGYMIRILTLLPGEV